jgi:hypothetical protein
MRIVLLTVALLLILLLALASRTRRPGQRPRPAGIEPLAAQLQRWASDGLLSQEQATAILAAEQARVRRQATPARPVSVVVELGPMSQREVIAAGGATSADDLHLVLSAATGLFVAAYVATTAVGLGWVFRLYSVATIATALVFGLLSGQVDKLEAGAPTPYMGLLERIGIGGWLVWMAVVAMVLWRTNRSPKLTVRHTPEPVDTVGALDAH